MIEDFTKTELEIVKKALTVRWKDAKLQLADIDVSRKASDSNLTACPAVVWEKVDCTFIVIKVDKDTYKSLFYYLGTQRFDTGIIEYNDLTDCVLALLKTQANFLLSKRVNK